MEDRRSSFPTHDSTPQPNILDGFHMRTKNASIEVVHKRYYILLVIGVILVGAISFYAPTGMMRALHCEKDETHFTYTILSKDALSDASTEKITSILDGSINAESTCPQGILPEDAVSVLKSYSTAHMIQQDAVFDKDGILIYPEDATNYALYATKDASYVFALDKAKFRYHVKDDGAFYDSLLDIIQSK